LTVSRWQHNLRKWFKELSLGTKITLGSTVGHIVILFCLFFVYNGTPHYSITIAGTMIDRKIPIIFLPLHKSLKQQVTTKSLGKNNTVVSTAVDVTQEVVLPQENKKRTTIVNQPLQKIQKTKNNKKAKQKITSSPQEKQKILAEEQKKEAPKVIEKPIVQSNEMPEVKNLPQTDLSATSLTNIDEQEVLYVGQEEMDALRVQEYIQSEMSEHWRPPAGMRKNICCVISVVVAHDGALASITMDQASGVLLFDGAARRAAAQLQPPRWAYGKTLSLTFKP
jgi:outer membrane biosynthesis protein TonB